ncbi:MAG: Xaa-Pro aminopeptidase [Arenicella sp.]|jgi:Xaa-Pro aminopeptidase
MTIGVGGSIAEQELTRLSNMTQGVQAITQAEYTARQKQAQQLMQQQGIDAVYLNAGTNLYYFTGMRWGVSERMVGAILRAKGQLEYIAPRRIRRIRLSRRIRVSPSSLVKVFHRWLVLRASWQPVAPVAVLDQSELPGPLRCPCLAH